MLPLRMFQRYIIRGGYRRAEKSRKVLMMKKAAKLDLAGPRAGQKQGRSGPGAKQEPCVLILRNLRFINFSKNNSRISSLCFHLFPSCILECSGKRNLNPCGMVFPMSSKTFMTKRKKNVLHHSLPYDW